MADDDIPSIPRPSGPRPIRGPGAAAVRGSGAGRGRPRLVPLLLIAAVAMLFLAPMAARRLTDWMWYREIGYQRVFLLRIVAQWTTTLLAGVGGFALLYGNARRALRGFGAERDAFLSRPRPGVQADVMTLARLADIAALPVCALLAIGVAVVASGEWTTLVQFFYRSPFGYTDPVFGRDVSYYVFTLPVIEAALDYIGLLLLLALGAVTVPIYIARGEIAQRLWPMTIRPFAQLHVGFLAALLMLVVGVRLILVAPPSLLLSPHTVLTGASYTDLHVRIPALRILGMLAVVAAGSLVWGAWRGRLVRLGGLALAGYVGAALLLTAVVPAMFQRLVVQANELAREAPQIRHHIESTRRAWGIDDVDRRELGAQQRLTRREIEANQATIANVRLWDRAPLLQTFGQIQAIRTYYDFVAVDDDRYRIGNELRQVLLSARELNTAALPTQTFINEHLTFTHGMGLTLGPSNQVTAEGLPVLWIKDLPPASSINIRVTQPQIYFGELANEFILAPTRQRELDYPAGEGDEAAVYSTYGGEAGVPVGSFFSRLLFAVRFGSLNILLSRDHLPETRILYRRSVLERAQLALPFLRFDQDPYLVITDAGELKWILDAYTTTDRFPYAYRLSDGTSYMRNSVKVVIDAYHGTVQSYVVDANDPMIRTLARIYPGLLLPIDGMAPDVRAHVRYPEDLFRMQTAVYATFHMSDPETFYHREDQWEVPASQRGTERGGFIRHMVMRLPGERDPEFILMRPFTPRQKDNLAAWMVARNDGDHYGQLVAYRFPRQSLVFGPTQIANRINQDTEVSRQISLWSQGGSEVIRGELLVIPIEESLLYVQPLYLRSQGGQIPELKRVIVAHENQVAMEETLELGLRRLFDATTGGSPAVTAEGRPGAPSAAGRSADTSAAIFSQLLRSATEHYERARAAQRADDWATYGEEMRRLGEVLRRLEAMRPGGG